MLDLMTRGVIPNADEESPPDLEERHETKEKKQKSKKKSVDPINTKGTRTKPEARKKSSSKVTIPDNPGLGITPSISSASSVVPENDGPMTSEIDLSVQDVSDVIGKF